MGLQYTFNGICRGTTKAGTPCRRRVVFGFCKHHGGDSTEYMRERARQIAEKCERRLAKWQRKLKRMRAGQG